MDDVISEPRVQRTSDGQDISVQTRAQHAPQHRALTKPFQGGPIGIPTNPILPGSTPHPQHI